MDNDKTIVWRTEKRKISELEPAPYNPRELTEKQAQDLSTSLERFNLADPIVINTNNRIIGGHQRINILKAKVGNNGFEVDVRVPSRKLTEHEEKELNLRLNKNLGQWDLDALANFDEDLLKDVGFDSKELDRIFQLEDKPEDDEIPPERAETGVVLGDLYQLGEHRLLCGDATKKEDVERLMGGERADMVFTDPPYGIDLDTDWSDAKSNLKFYKEKKCRGQGNKYDKIIGDNIDFNPIFIFDYFDVEEIFLWGGDYYSKRLNGGSWFVWDKRSNENTEFNKISQSDKMYGSCFELCWSKNKHKREIARIKWAGIFGTETEPDKDKSRKHPTQKPVALGEWFIEKFSKRDNVIVDIFGGSGSTLIACEKLNRKCRMMEIDPVYCQVIIDRWEKFTGKKAEKINVDSNSNELVGSGSKHLQA